MKQRVFIFDLDETVIDSRHRTPNKDDGTLNLDAYRAKHTPENVAKDTLLPLARTMQQLIAAGETVVIITARDMKECDYNYLSERGLIAPYILSRDVATPEHYKMSDGSYKTHWLTLLPFDVLTECDTIMFDDAKPVKSAIRALGIPTICGHKVNRKLAKNDTISK